MNQLIGAEVSTETFKKSDGKSVSGAHIRRYVIEDGKRVVKTVPYTRSLRQHERQVRQAVQKGLFDLALNLGPIFQSTDKKDKEVLRQAQLQAEESDFADQFDGVYTAFQLIQPPVDPASLVHISQRLPIIDPIIDSMKTNIEGFGQIFTSILDFDNPETQEDLKDHFAGRLLHELETDGVMRIRKLYDGKAQGFIAKSGDEWLDFIDSKIQDAVPILKHRLMEDEDDLDLAIKAWKNDVPLIYEENREVILKIRQRSFNQKLAKMKTEKRDEKRYLKNFFANCNCKLSWMQVRKRLRDDFERIGGWAMEVLRNRITRQPEQLGHVPMVDIRLTKLSDAISAPVTRRINEVEIVEEMRPVKFRKFVQALGRTGKFIWFKEFGDPRIMNRNNGTYVGEYVWNQKSKQYDRIFYEDYQTKTKRMSEEQYLARFPNFIEANEILFHARYNAIGSPYPVPRWFGCLTLAQGMIAMEEVNAGWFDNDLVPPMIVKVSDGNLSQKSENRIRAIFEGRRGREKKHSIVVLEAESKARARNFANTGKPVIEIEKMRDVIQSDATHTQYDEKGRVKVRACWRLPPAHIGQESQYTRQSINASKVISEEQVFQPERADYDDVMNKHLMPAMRINHWWFKTNSPPVADNLQMAQVLSTLGKAGFLTVGEARPEVEQILNRPLEKFEDDGLSDTPFPLILIEAKAQARPNKGPQDDAAENPQNKMGARPDKDGFTTDSEVVKTYVEKSTGLNVGKVAVVEFNDADEALLDMVNTHGASFIREADGELFFCTKDRHGRMMSFRQGERRAA
jgi:capsid portal protein